MTPIDPVFLLIPILQAIKPVSIYLESRPDRAYGRVYPQPQNDGSVGLFQPLDDIFDEAVPKIVQSVNGRTSSGDAPPISPEDMLSLTRYDCIINGLNRICDFQSACAAQPSLFSLSLSSEEIVPHMMDKTQISPRSSRFTVTLKTR
jgi:ribonuclease H2 subunit B